MKSFEEHLAVQEYKAHCREVAARRRRDLRHRMRKNQRSDIAFAVSVIIWAVFIIFIAFQSRAKETPPPPSIDPPVIEEPVIEEPMLDSPPATEYAALPEELMPTYTVEDLETLALVIYQEAGGDACSDETRFMVGNVVLNRVADPRYPDTIVEVATQRQQYGRLYWTGLVWPERATLPQEWHAVKRAYDCAELLLEGERVLPDDVIYQAEFIQGTEVVAEADGFYFCR